MLSCLQIISFIFPSPQPLSINLCLRSCIQRYNSASLFISTRRGWRQIFSEFTRAIMLRRRIATKSPLTAGATVHPVRLLDMFRHQQTGCAANYFVIYFKNCCLISEIGRFIGSFDHKWGSFKTGNLKATINCTLNFRTTNKSASDICSTILVHYMKL